MNTTRSLLRKESGRKLQPSSATLSDYLATTPSVSAFTKSGSVAASMSMKGQITEDMKSAMKAGDKDRLKVVRLMLAAIKQIEVDTRAELDDAAVLTVVTKMVKQRRDSIEAFEKGDREDLAAIERAEILVLEDYLPEQLSAADLAAMVDEVIQSTGAEGIRDMGKVMGLIKTKAAGRADMGAVSATVKERLSAL